MNQLLDSPYFRAAVTAGLTWAAFKYLPAGSVWKLAAVAVGAVSTAAIVGQAIPLVGNVMAGRLPVSLPAPAAQ